MAFLSAFELGLGVMVLGRPWSRQLKSRPPVIWKSFESAAAALAFSQVIGISFAAAIDILTPWQLTFPQYLKINITYRNGRPLFRICMTLKVRKYKF